jgi:hypothetical protein
MDPGRDCEEELFDIIHGDEAHDGGGDDVGANDGGGDDVEVEDGSEFLNDAGEGMEIEARDSSHNVRPLPNPARYIKPLVIQLNLDAFLDVYILTNVSSFRHPHRAYLLEGNEARPKGWPIMCISQLN